MDDWTRQNAGCSSPARPRKEKRKRLILAALYVLLLASLAAASELPPLDTLWVNSMLRNPQVERVSVRDSAGTLVAILTFADGAVDTIRFQGPHIPVIMAGDKPAVKYSIERFEVQGSPYGVIDTMHWDTAWEARHRFAERARFTWQLATLLRAYRDSCWADSTMDSLFYLGHDLFVRNIPANVDPAYSGPTSPSMRGYAWIHRLPTFTGFLDFVERQAARDSTALAEED